jgi:hypothetical protein
MAEEAIRTYSAEHLFEFSSQVFEHFGVPRVDAQQAAYGKIAIALRAGKAIPLGWAIDRDGHSATRPEQMIESGALLPQGDDREHSGQNGYCLAALVDILSWDQQRDDIGVRVYHADGLVFRGEGRTQGPVFSGMRCSSSRIPDSPMRATHQPDAAKAVASR